MLVWNLQTDEFIDLKEWMKWCPWIRTSHISKEVWETMYPPPKKKEK